MNERTALVVGATGIVGRNLTNRLLADGWKVIGLARRPRSLPAAATPLEADLNDTALLREKLTALSVSHVFLTTWTPCATEAEAIAVNGRHVREVLAAIGQSRRRVSHVALVTGVKHYQGPFSEFGWVRPETPFVEDRPRLPIENFYYAQEDELFAAAARDGFGWSVHRPNSIVGYALGSLMNAGLTIACYASLCREMDLPFAFTGVPSQWNGLSEVSDARLIARQLVWAATSPAARNQAFNTANGDVFRWRTLWPQIAAHFGLSAPAYEGEHRMLQEIMAEAAPAWRRLAERHGLVEADIGRLATWWHTDFDWGREIDSISDMGKARKAGFLDYQSTPDTFTDLFRSLEADRVIPPARPAG